MMGADGEQEDDRDWNADQPEQDRTHNQGLLIARSAGTMVRLVKQFR
jgi:hypothetical protein